METVFVVVVSLRLLKLGLLLLFEVVGIEVVVVLMTSVLLEA